MLLITLIFSIFFNSNFIIQYLMFMLVLSHCTLYRGTFSSFYIWSVVSAVAAFLDPWSARFYC